MTVCVKASCALCNTWNDFSLCVILWLWQAARFSIRIQISNRQYEEDRCPSQVWLWTRSLSFCLRLKAYSEDGLSAPPWALMARCSDTSKHNVTIKLDLIQPDKQNCSCGEQTSVCQPPVSLWTGLGPLPGNQIVLFRPTNCRRGIGCERCLSLSILKARTGFVRVFFFFLPFVASIHLCISTKSFGSIISSALC